jgi:HK97 family phage portal protein
MGGLVASLMASSTQLAPRDVTNDRHFGGDLTTLGGPMSAETVITAEAVFPCVSLIAETLGSFPLDFVRRDGSATGADYPLAEALNESPNPLMTGPDFWGTFAFNAVLRGRAYAEPIFYSPTELELWPLLPSRLVEAHGERTFGVDYFYEDGRSRRFRAGQLLTGSGLSADGVFAVAPWKTARAAIDMANTLEAFGRNFFRNGARPTGILSTDQELSQEALDRLKDQFNGNFAGVLNAGKVPILEASLKYLPISENNSDNQYLELGRNMVRKISRNWRIPLFMLNEGDDPKSEEAGAQRFVKYTMRPWTRRVEKAIARDIMTSEQRALWKPKFNMDALLRGDSATQWRNAVLARTASALSVNELRTDWFNQPRINESWADNAREPLNSNRAADTMSGGMTAPQDRSDA